jgi:hypothetical protein
MEHESVTTRSALLFEAPASKWEEAIPVGKGRLGAMVTVSFSQGGVSFRRELFASYPDQA